MQRLQPRGGITQFVSGAGGASPYRVDRGDRRLIFGRSGIGGALRIVLSPGSGDLRVPRLGGTPARPQPPHLRIRLDRPARARARGRGSRSSTNPASQPHPIEPLGHARVGAGSAPASPASSTYRYRATSATVYEGPAANSSPRVASRRSNAARASEPRASRFSKTSRSLCQRPESFKVARVAELRLDPVLLEEHRLVHAGARKPIGPAAA